MKATNALRVRSENFGDAMDIGWVDYARIPAAEVSAPRANKVGKR
jgi:hypothetical protein